MRRTIRVALLSALLLAGAGLLSSCDSSIKKVGDQIPFTTFLECDGMTQQQIETKLEGLGFKAPEYDNTSLENGDVSVAMNDLNSVPAELKVTTIYRDVFQKWEKELVAAGYTLDKTISPSGDFTWQKIYIRKADDAAKVVSIAALEDKEVKESGVYMFELYQ